MECKGPSPVVRFSAKDCIDLTRMECKVFTEELKQTDASSIDLTRMECKVVIIIVCRISCWYRFNQNGM